MKRLNQFFVCISAEKLTCPRIDPTPVCAPSSKPNCFTGGPKCGGGKACCLDHDCTHKCVDPALPDGKLVLKQIFWFLENRGRLTLKLKFLFERRGKV